VKVDHASLSKIAYSGHGEVGRQRQLVDLQAARRPAK
jgi:hypothetical protein